MAHAREPKPKPAASPAVQYFLILYNFISATLWFSILGRVLVVLFIFNSSRVYLGVGQFAKWTQTLALLEIVFSATGTTSCDTSGQKKRDGDTDPLTEIRTGARTSHDHGYAGCEPTFARLGGCQ